MRGLGIVNHERSWMTARTVSIYIQLKRVQLWNNWAIHKRACVGTSSVCWDSSICGSRPEVFAFLSWLFFPSPCPPVMWQSSVGGFACYLGSRCSVWTLFLARRFQFTDVETSRRFRFSRDRLFRSLWMHITEYAFSTTTFSYKPSL